MPYRFCGSYTPWCGALSAFSRAGPQNVFNSAIGVLDNGFQYWCWFSHSFLSLRSTLVGAVVLFQKFLRVDHFQKRVTRRKMSISLRINMTPKRTWKTQETIHLATKAPIAPTLQQIRSMSPQYCLSASRVTHRFLQINRNCQCTRETCTSFHGFAAYLA